MKKILAFLIVLAILLTSASCSAGKSVEEGPKDAEKTEAVPAEAKQGGASEETDAPETEIPDNLPARDFAGQALRIAAEPDKEYEIRSEELNGEITNDVIYNRNVGIEERFNAKIESVILSAGQKDNIQNILVQNVTAGEDAYDMVSVKAWLSYVPILAKALLNWKDIPYVDLEQPWYYKTTNDKATINGKLYNISSYLAVTALLDTYAMFFNERICTEYGYPSEDLYNLVYEGKWVYDTFNSILSGIYADTNGNGVTDKEDTLGYVGGLCHPLDIWLAAFDQPISSKDGEGNIQIEIMTDKTVSALEKIYDLTYNNPASFRETIDYTEYKTFAQSNAAFTPLPFHTAFNELREMTDTYGILPLPKWNEEQAEYRTHIYDQYSTFNIPKTVNPDRYEFIGIMMEALCAGSFREVYPAYYDVALKNKYASDENAAAMIDLIRNGAGMDLTFMFSDSFMRVSFMFRDLINNKNTDIASQYKKIEKSMLKTIERNIVKAYAD